MGTWIENEDELTYIGKFGEVRYRDGRAVVVVGEDERVVARTPRFGDLVPMTSIKATMQRLGDTGSADA